MALLGHRLQHRRVRPPCAGFHPLAARQAHAVEQHFTELFRTAEIERPSGEAVDVAFDRLHAAAEIRAHRAKIVRVHADARALHRQQHRSEPPVDLLV